MYLDIRETTTIKISTKSHSTKELISSASNEQNSPPFTFFGDEENGLFQHQQLTTIKQQQQTTTKSNKNNEIKSKNSILFDKENKPFSTSTITNLNNKKKLEEIENLLNFNKAEENTTTNDSVETSGCRFFCSSLIRF